MKWLRENWTKVVLVLLLIGAGFLWRNSIENKRDYKTKIEKYENDITLRNDSISNLKIKLNYERIKSDSLVKENDELDIKIDEQELVIERKDKELAAEKRKIKQLPANEQIELLADNLSNEMNENVDLKMRTTSGDTLVDLSIKQTGVVNTVFADKNRGIIKLNNMDELLVIKNDKIDNLDLLIISKDNSIGILTDTIGQKDEIIADKDEEIKLMKKNARKKKVKNFFIGLGTGIATTAVVILAVMAGGQ